MPVEDEERQVAAVRDRGGVVASRFGRPDALERLGRGDGVADRELLRVRAKGQLGAVAEYGDDRERGEPGDDANASASHQRIPSSRRDAGRVGGGAGRCWKSPCATSGVPPSRRRECAAAERSRGRKSKLPRR